MNKGAFEKRWLGPIGMTVVVALLVMSLDSCGGGNSGPTVRTVTVGSPLVDAVARFGFNYYQATVTPGALYKVSITGLGDDADLAVSGADSSFQTLATCAVDTTPQAGTAPEDCILFAPSGTLYFGVDGAFVVSSSAGYTIDVEPVPAFDLTLSLPMADAVTQAGAKVYRVNGATQGLLTAAITAQDNDADLHVFGNDSTLATKAVCSPDNLLFIGTTPEDCTFSSSGGSAYLIVDGLFSTAPSAGYTVLVAPAPVIANPANEGSTASPVSVVADVPATGQMGNAGTSYYAVSGLIAGGRYTVSVVGLSSNANLAAFGADSAFQTPASCLINNTFFAGTIPEACTLVSQGATLFFSVAAGPGSATYLLLVEPGP
ncbi:MAG: hypothetical protein M0042_08205 [Nitrospiraceae bacterium]|nr:hypothetical protein [Nitrospiraceae bacterium]